MRSGSTSSLNSIFATLPVKLTLLFILSFGLLLASSRECVADPLRGSVPVDVELDSNGTLTGEVHSVDGLLPGARRVSVFRGSHLVAEAPLATDGGFRFEGLDGGVYWVATPGTGQSVRAWATGTAPPTSQHRLVLVHDVVTPVSVTQQAVVVAQLPYGPMTNYVAQPMPAYPFQPYQVPGGGMIFPGYYTSPGAAFFGPLVTTAVVTAVTGVIVVAVDDDDDENRAASP